VNRTDRLYALVEELRAVAPRPRSARWLAGRFEVSARTIERDISALQQSGVPIYAEGGRCGGYVLDAAMTLPPINFTPAEATAIAVALDDPGASAFPEAARQAMRKVLAAMRASDAAAARELGGKVRRLMFADRVPPLAPSKVIEEAVLAGRVLRIGYADRNDVISEREVEPIALVAGRDHWYLLGWCRLRQSSRSFRLDRIRTARLLDELAVVRRFEDVAPKGIVARAIEVA
jgi:predicted DNA-binding transcriptional regulator YafY